MKHFLALSFLCAGLALIACTPAAGGGESSGSGVDGGGGSGGGAAALKTGAREMAEAAAEQIS